MIDHLLDRLAPHICCSCGDVGRLICENCISDIKEEVFAQCMVCLRPALQDNNLCTGCKPDVSFGAVWVVGERQAALKQLIDNFKFNRAKSAALICAELFDDRLPVFQGPTLVTSIPSIGSHRRHRGYDHMYEVAKRLAKKRDWQHESLLVRQTSLPQRGLSLQKRLHQQAGAFVALSPGQPCPILLIDDVYTTGGTLTAAVTALRAVTDQPIFVAVLARQPLK